MSASIKPELYISIKPLRGFIGVKPEIYAVIDCTPVARLEETTADTKRVIVKNENVTGDTLRKISKAESATGDTIKIVKAYEQATADTLRIIMQGYEADEISSADTLRRIVKAESTIADTLIRNAKNEVATADTLRIINNVEIATADTLRQIVETATADTCRVITKTEKAVADTIIRVPHILKYVIENNPVTFRGTKSLKNTPAYSLINSFKDYGVTSVSISLNEKTLSDNFQFEVTRPMEINDAVRGQLLDYEFNFLVEETSQSDFAQSVKGMYDVDKLLYTQLYISEDGKETPLMSASSFIGKVAHHLGFNSDVQIDDFTPYHDFSGSEITYKDLLTQIFGWTSRLPHRQINIFIRGDTLHCIQRGKEISTFDISNIPHSRPTINKTLIRSLWNRPHDENEDEDEDTPFSGTISYSNPETTISITYNNGLLISEHSRRQDGHDYTSSGMKSLSISNKKYDYKSINGETYLSQQTNTNIVTNFEEKTRIEEQITTNYFYKTIDGSNIDTTESEVYLFEEDEETKKNTWSIVATYGDILQTRLIDPETSFRKTSHTPVGNGWYVQNVFVDGEYQGSNLSQGKPGNSISPYTVKQVNAKLRGKKRKKDKKETYEDWRQRLSTIADISFPVRELDIVQELTNEIFWLNRKIQVEVDTDLISPINNGVPTITHIVDFTERVVLDGVEYFLVSNQIQFTPRKLIQKLKLIRWYAQ